MAYAILAACCGHAVAFLYHDSYYKAVILPITAQTWTCRCYDVRQWLWDRREAELSLTEAGYRVAAGLPA
jgi:hypothetical protein